VAYRIDPSAPVESEVRELARTQVDKAISGLEHPGDDPEAAVHDCRTRCKKVRGLARLVRPALGAHYAATNVTFRDAARQLGPMRDAQVLVTTFDAVCDAQPNLVAGGAVADVRHALRRRADAATRGGDEGGDRLAAALDLLRDGRSVVDGWELGASGFDALAGGLRDSYAKGRDALAAAGTAPTPDAFHEYRKRVKDAWYHVRLLRATSPAILDPLAERLHHLSDALGDAHDLAVLSEQLRADVDAFGGERQVEAALTIVDGRRADLERRAVSVGARLYAETSKAYARRFAAYWSAWQGHGPEPRVGGIGDLGR
jgi:CHAD domain-containing protein